MMPVMNGYEAAKMIRSLDREDAKVIPIIAMTANAFTEDKMRAKEAGMDEHIAKPVDGKLLVKVINELVKRDQRGVARCLDGIMSLSRISVRTSRKSSEKDPTNPPKTIRAGSPVKLIRKAKSTPIVPNSRIAR